MIVMTRGINNEIAEDIEFSKFVTNSLKRFLIKDWGIQHPEDRKMNDEDPMTALGCYINAEEKKIWIKSDYANEEGTKRVITVLFPSEM